MSSVSLWLSLLKSSVYKFHCIIEYLTDQEIEYIDSLDF